MSRPDLRVAVVGAGAIGGLLAARLAALPDVEVNSPALADMAPAVPG